MVKKGKFQLSLLVILFLLLGGNIFAQEIPLPVAPGGENLSQSTKTEQMLNGVGENGRQAIDGFPTGIQFGKTKSFAKMGETAQANDKACRNILADPTSLVVGKSKAYQDSWGFWTNKAQGALSGTNLFPSEKTKRVVVTSGRLSDTNMQGAIPSFFQPWGWMLRFQDTSMQICRVVRGGSNAIRGNATVFTAEDGSSPLFNDTVFILATRKNADPLYDFSVGNTITQIYSVFHADVNTTNWEQADNRIGYDRVADFSFNSCLHSSVKNQKKVDIWVQSVDKTDSYHDTAISAYGVELYFDPACDPVTPTATPTNTEVPPTATATGTDVPPTVTVDPTLTATIEPTVTPTSTPGGFCSSGGLTVFTEANIVNGHVFWEFENDPNAPDTAQGLISARISNLSGHTQYGMEDENGTGQQNYFDTAVLIPGAVYTSPKFQKRPTKDVQFEVFIAEGTANLIIEACFEEGGTGGQVAENNGLIPLP